MDQVNLRAFMANDRSWLVAQHQTFYARDEGFDASFGALVARILDDFLAGHDPECEAGWIAERSEGLLGSIFCVRQGPDTAKLRLFYLVPEARGLGIGRKMLETCMAFARRKGYRDMQLWTHASHKAACALYQAYGWQLESSKPVHSFGQDLIEQHWRYCFQGSCISE
ncbi:MAG: GNAT family N-acetyltransferase [Pseudomonadota bacterium]